MTLVWRKRDATMKHHESARLIVYNIQPPDEALYSRGYYNAITIRQMSERKHVFRGECVKELKGAKKSKIVLYTHCVVCDRDIYLEAMGSRSKELSQEILSDSKSDKAAGFGSNIARIRFRQIRNSKVPIPSHDPFC